MSLNYWPQHCPKCRSHQIRALFRVEAGGAGGGDLEVYECEDCGEEFDSDDHRFAQQKG